MGKAIRITEKLEKYINNFSLKVKSHPARNNRIQ